VSYLLPLSTFRMVMNITTLCNHRSNKNTNSIKNTLQVFVSFLQVLYQQQKYCLLTETKGTSNFLPHRQLPI